MMQRLARLAAADAERAEAAVLNFYTDFLPEHPQAYWLPVYEYFLARRIRLTSWPLEHP